MEERRQEDGLTAGREKKKRNGGRKKWVDFVCGSWGGKMEKKKGKGKNKYKNGRRHLWELGGVVLGEQKWMEEKKKEKKYERDGHCLGSGSWGKTK